MMDADTLAADRGREGFALCELEWMRTRLIAELRCDRLAAFVTDVQAGRGALGADAVCRISAMVDTVEELVVAIGLGLSPRAVSVSKQEVELAAAGAIADGIADPERAMHALSWLDAANGLRALSTALIESDAHQFWDVPLSRLLMAIRGVDVHRARSFARHAGVGDDAHMSELADHEIAMLARTLRQQATCT